LIATIPVTVAYSPVNTLAMTAEPGRLYVGVTLAHSLKAFTRDSFERKDVVARWRSSNDAIASVDKWGNVTALKPGTATITADADGAKATKTYTIIDNPVKAIDIGIKEEVIRTGEVVHLAATLKAADGKAVTDAPVTWASLYARPDSRRAGRHQGSGSGIIQFGRFAPNYRPLHAHRAIGIEHRAQSAAVTPRDISSKFRWPAA
jgi:hypothetical protein